MEILPINAAALLQEPDQTALLQVHAQLENSREAGLALYFSREHPHPGIWRPNFLLGLEDQAYFALQVAALPQGVRGGRLVLVPEAAGERPESSPVGYLSARAVGISKDVKKSLGYRIFVIPVAVFPGEGPDNAVQAWAIQHNVGLLLGVERMVDQLVDIAEEYEEQIYMPPAMAEIREVMGALNAGALPQAAQEVDAAPAPGGNLMARQVIIRHADTVNVYTVGTVGAGADARDDTDLPLDVV